ncbi:MULTISPECIES: hypothetical protein [Nocardia]|nr:MULTISPECIES: hypothetical protein [Nocardia]
MSSESNRPPGHAPQPFGPPVGSADWYSPPRPPQPPQLRDSRPAASPPRIVRRPPESPEWAIDPDAIQLALGPATRPPRRPRGRKWWIAASATVVVLALVGGGIALAVTATRKEPGTAAAIVTSTASAPAGSAETSAPAPGPQTPACPAEAHDGIVVGNGAGGVTDGPNSILGFEYSYYTERSGERAQAFVAPDTVNVAPAVGLQQAIDTVIPVGTTYCVHITTREPELFDVDIEEYRPDGGHTTYRQSVRTVVRDGRTLLYEIRGR